MATSQTPTVPTVKAGTAGVPANLGPWALTGRYYVPDVYADQGLATVAEPGGGVRTVYTGSADVTPALTAAGWVHVGDPDSWDGWVVTPFQGPAGATTKMFAVTSPAGKVTEAVHPLDPGEQYNNSFAAITPDGQWVVSGEWGEMNRLLVFPTLVVNPVYPGSGPLPLASTVALSDPVEDLQGCAFRTATQLFCSSLTDLVEVDLDRPIGGSGQVSATTRNVAPLPEVGGCAGTYEPEGLDIDRSTGTMRVEVNQPGVCSLLTQVYEYRWTGAAAP